MLHIIQYISDNRLRYNTQTFFELLDDVDDVDDIDALIIKS